MKRYGIFDASTEHLSFPFFGIKLEGGQRPALPGRVGSWGWSDMIGSTNATPDLSFLPCPGSGFNQPYSYLAGRYWRYASMAAGECPVPDSNVQLITDSTQFVADQVVLKWHDRCKWSRRSYTACPNFGAWKLRQGAARHEDGKS